MKKLFLDLEDTVITPVMEGWHTAEAINLDTIKKIIDIFKPDTVDLFSFAIHNEHEKKLFDKFCRNYLEASLGVKLFMVPRVDEDILTACARQKGIHPEKLTFSDVSDFWSKDLAFQLWAQENFKNVDYPTQCIFLDDMVKSSYFKKFDNSFEAYTINIDELVADFDRVCGQIHFLETQSPKLKVR